MFSNKILESETERGISLIAYADHLPIVTTKTGLEDKTQHVMKLIMWKLAEMEMQVAIKTE